MLAKRQNCVETITSDQFHSLHVVAFDDIHLKLSLELQIQIINSSKLISHTENW